MRKRHYEALAKALARTKPVVSQARYAEFDERYKQWLHDIDAVAAVLQTYYGTFDYMDFRDACRTTTARTIPTPKGEAAND